MPFQFRELRGRKSLHDTVHPRPSDPDRCGGLDQGGTGVAIAIGNAASGLDMVKSEFRAGETVLIEEKFGWITYRVPARSAGTEQSWHESTDYSEF